MSFFAVELATSAAAKNKSTGRGRGRPGGHVPIEAMRQLACRACPTHEHWTGATKLEAEGPRRADVLVLWSEPSEDSSRRGRFGESGAEREVDKILRRLEIRYRSFSTVRCRPAQGAPSLHQTECCRGFVEEEVASTQPRVILAVGDAALQWALKLEKQPTAHTFRGRYFPVRIAGHSCWLYCVSHPKYADRERKSSKVSTHEQVFRADLSAMADLLNSDARPTVVQASEVFQGVEILTGDEPGAMQKLEDFLNWAAVQPLVGVDYETNKLRPHLGDPKIATAAIGTFSRTLAFAVSHPQAGWGTESRVRKVHGLLAEFLRDSGKKVAHNLAMELEWSHELLGAQTIDGDWEDTMIQAFTLDGRSGVKGLGVQTALHFGFDLKVHSNVDTSGIMLANLPDVLRYNGGDAKWTAALFPVNRALLDADGLQDVYARRRDLAPALVRTQAKGMPVDVGFAERYSDELRDLSAQAAKRALATPEVRQYESKYGRFDVGNDDHVTRLMAVMLKRPETEKQEWNGAEMVTRISCDADALGAMPAKEVPSAAHIVRHRVVEKLLSTYVVPLATGRDVCRDGKVRTQYSSTRAVTGRLSSEDPNLQNIPIRTPEGRKVREAFVAPPGGWMLAMDYGQIEARIIGMASRDENLMRYQWTDYDIHGFWAKRIYEEYPRVVDWVVRTFSVDWDKEGLKTLRQETKNKWVFPQFFGSRTESCAADLHIPEDVAADLGAEFWDEFKGVKKWQNGLVKFHEKHQYVETLGGFRRRGPMTLNELINAPVQGSAAEIVQAAQTELSHLSVLEEDENLQPVLNVHDDLTFLLPDLPNLGDHIKRIASIMCRHRYDWISVPLIVEAKIGTTWNAMKPLGDYRSDVLHNLRNPFK